MSSNRKQTTQPPLTMRVDTRPYADPSTGVLESAGNRHLNAMEHIAHRLSDLEETLIGRFDKIALGTFDENDASGPVSPPTPLPEYFDALRQQTDRMENILNNIGRFLDRVDL